MQSQRVADLKPSATIALSNRVAELRRQGADILGLSVGEPDFPTPQPIRLAATAALEAGHTGYTPSRGLPKLREMIARDIESRSGIQVDSNQVIITPAKLGIFMAIQASIDQGAEVLLPDPIWGTYADAIRFAGGKVVRVAPNERLEPDPESLKSKISDSTRMLIINSPCNPTGVVYSKEILHLVTDLAEDHDFPVLSDEIYQQIIFTGTHLSPQSWCDKVITINGFSKSHAMTGWRLGWVTGPRSFIDDLDKIQQTSYTCATSFAQYGALAAPQTTSHLAEMMREYTKRRELVVSGLSAIRGVKLLPPEGTFYAFPRFDLGLESRELAARLLDDCQVALTPGIAFGDAGEYHLRFSFATSIEVINKAIERIAGWVENYRRV